MNQTADAPVAAPDTERADTSARASRNSVVALIVAIATVVGVSLIRIVSLGFAPVAPDDAVYIGVGRSLWGLHEPLGIDHTLFTVRSWAFPVMTGGFSRLFDRDLFSNDPFTGPRILGWILGTAALSLAVVIAFRLARGPAAVSTAVVLLATPVLWTIVPTTRVDVALIWFLMLVLLVVDTPTPKRMIVGGILAGVTLLVKETSAPLVVLPLAYLGTMPRDQWWKLAQRYLIAFAATVGWWFVTVLILVGEIFPFEGLRQASGRHVPRDWTLNTSAKVLIGAWVVGWVVLAIGRRKDPRARLLILAALAFVPASLIAWQKEFALRQFAPIVLLSCIALGVAVVDLLAIVLRRAPRRAVPRLAAVLAIVLIVVALVPIVLTQDRTGVGASSGTIEKDIAAGLAALPGSRTIVSTFRFKGQVWARVQGGDADIRGLHFENPADPPALGPLVSTDFRQERYHVLRRAELARQVRGADYLLLTGPHPLGPIALATWLQVHGTAVGITPVAHFGPRSRTSWAYLYQLDNPKVAAIPSIVSTTAAEQMLADGDFKPVEPMVIAGTVGGFIRLGRAIPIDQYEQLPAELR